MIKNIRRECETNSTVTGSRLSLTWRYLNGCARLLQSSVIVIKIHYRLPNLRGQKYEKLITANGRLGTDHIPSREAVSRSGSQEILHPFLEPEG